MSYNTVLFIVQFYVFFRISVATERNIEFTILCKIRTYMLQNIYLFL